MKLRPFATVFLLLALLLPNVLPTAHASRENRTDRRFGLMAGFNAHPAVSVLSLNLGVNLTSFVRLHAGAGGVNDGIGDNIARGAYNVTFAPLGYIGARLIHVLFVAPINSKAKAPRFADFRKDFKAGDSIATYGAGADVFVPGWKLSPAFGVHYARMHTKGRPYGLKKDDGHTYYSAGIDWQTASGLQLGAGYNHCPTLPKQACGGYGNLGIFF